MNKHLFYVNTEDFEVTFNEQFKALQLKTNKDLRIESSVNTGVYALGDHNYVFMYPIANTPLIQAPIDEGYTGNITLITSRPITLPKGFTFYLMELKGHNNEVAIPDNMKYKQPAYKGDIGNDTYLKHGSEVKSDIQFMVENDTTKVFFPRSSAAKKGYEVHVNHMYTTIMKSDLSLLTNEEAYSVIQLVKGSVNKFTDKVEFLTDEEFKDMHEKVSKKSERGAKKEGSSDAK